MSASIFDPRNTPLTRPKLQPKSRLARFQQTSSSDLALTPSASPILRFSTPDPTTTPVTTSPRQRRRTSSNRDPERERVGLLALPIEILHLIGLELPFAGDVFYLSFTCRHLSAIYAPSQNHFWFHRRHRFLEFSSHSSGSDSDPPKWDYRKRPTMIQKDSAVKYDPMHQYCEELKTLLAVVFLPAHSNPVGRKCPICCWNDCEEQFQAFFRGHCGSCYHILVLTEFKHQSYRLHRLSPADPSEFYLHPYLSPHGRRCKLLHATTRHTYLNPPTPTTFVAPPINLFGAGINTSSTSSDSRRVLGLEGREETKCEKAASARMMRDRARRIEKGIGCDLFWHATLVVKGLQDRCGGRDSWRERKL